MPSVMQPFSKKSGANTTYWDDNWLKQLNVFSDFCKVCMQISISKKNQQLSNHLVTCQLLASTCMSKTVFNAEFACFDLSWDLKLIGKKVRDNTFFLPMLPSNFFLLPLLSVSRVDFVVSACFWMVVKTPFCMSPMKF